MQQAKETRAGDSRPIKNIARGTQTSGDASARQVINELSTSVWAFSALACALEAGLLEALDETGSLAELSHRSGIAAPLVEGMLDVLVSLGLLLRAGNVYSSTPNLLPLLQAPARDALLADMRTVYLQSREMIDAAKRRTLLAGWYHTDPELLAAQGASGGPLFSMLAHALSTAGWPLSALAGSYGYFPGCWDGRRHHHHPDVPSLPRAARGRTRAAGCFPG